ncbi:shikimate dehydrogenase [Sphingomonas flavalba]|uniref:shikimate dehydrogenase n=1 Tax=Sphingomonas flavalba TaxID=2559804 RepID=UPI00109D99ED|nr:shikimate dehydrogenase [Sphingomonas flavalba]
MNPYAEVIGDPIAQSKSPLIHNFWLDRLGIAAVYRKQLVHPDGLAGYIASRRDDPAWRGCNVTMPHKTLVIPLIDDLDPLAAAIGAVNIVVPRDGRLFGCNSDVPGFLEPLQARIAAPAGGSRSRILVVGTGGAARAVVHALWDAGFTIILVGRTATRAAALAAEVAGADAAAIGTAALPDSDALLDESVAAVVNATSLGMTGQSPLPLSLDRLGPDAIVYDIVYSPLETPLLAAARRRGLRVIDGLEMLVGQAAMGFRLFYGQPPPRADDAALRALLLA